ncbi:MAG: class I SAM-dependent methyltransferase [Candidatus Moranbacteria bacterium]|nr:class I SAM-dependent methyltransferase [Candidatus Moranbacteria bacterium]
MNKNHSHKVFNDPEMFAQKFDALERDVWQKPSKVITSLALSDNAVVVEVGAGTGYFTIRLAEYLKNGKVIAFDQAPEMVAYLKKRVDDSVLTNVDVRLSGQRGNVDLEEKIDLVMCVDVYHHIDGRISYFSHLMQYLKHNGKIIIIDRPADSPVVPPHGHQTPPELVIKEMKQAGFELVEELDFLLPYQFYLTFKKV